MAELARFVPRDLHAVLWPCSVGVAALRRADHAWSDRASPDPLNIPGEMPSEPGTSATQDSSADNVRQPTMPCCKKNVNFCSGNLREWGAMHLTLRLVTVALRGRVFRLC